MTLSLKIGSAEAASHSKACGYVRVADYVGGTPVLVPVILIHGTEDGPVLWVESMIHGDEYHNIGVILELSRTLDPGKLRGSLVMVPAVNIAAVEVSGRETSVDHSDLFYAFPGSPDGHSSTSGPPTFAQQFVNSWLNLIKVTAHYLIDLHAGGLNAEIADVAMYPIVGNETDAVSKQLAVNFGFRHIIAHHYDPHTPNWFDNSIVTQCALRGIPSLVAEFPGLGGAPLDSQKIERVCTGIRNLMKHLKMIDGSPDIDLEQVFLEDMVNVATKRGGIILPVVKVGQRVSKDEMLATVVSFFGEEVEKVKSPKEGVVISIPTNPLVGTGSWPFEICSEVK